LGWTDEQRVVLGAVLEDLEDCREILRNLLTQPSSRPFAKA
jgi:hypothetical protein